MTLQGRRMTSGVAQGAGPKMAFFAHFTYKKMPPGGSFLTFNIYSRKIVRFECDESIRKGEIGEEGKTTGFEPKSSTPVNRLSSDTPLSRLMVGSSGHSSPPE